ncbi:MAG: Dabb family protein [Acidobacteriota bacterium]
MKSLTVFGALMINVLFLSCLTGCSPEPEFKIHGKDAIIHTVMFSLKASPDSEEAEDFLKDGKEILSSIPGVEKFEVRRQVSEKNNFQYGFSMQFTDRTAFDSYLKHPLHVSFVSERWGKEVSAFQEADYTAYPLD